MRVRVAAVALALLAGCVSQVQRARDLVAAGQRDAAVELLEATLREDPHEVDARLELARLRAEAGDLVRAEAQLRHAVEAAPARTDVRLELAGVLEALGSLPQAAHQLGEVRRRHGAAAVPDDRYRDLLTRAAARLRGQGDYAGAIAQYRRLQEDELVPAEGLAEDLESAWAAEAARLAGEGSRDAALAAWEEAEALDERDPDYPYARGKLLADMERHLDARTAFEEFLRRAATTPEAHAAAAERVGRWYAAREEHAHAVPYYEEAARLAPGEPRLLLTLAELHLKQGQTRPAEVTFSRYAAARGETAETFWSLGERARSLGARRLAERYLRRAWELSSGDFDVASGLAGLLAARGAREEAVRVMEAFMDAAVERAQAAFQVASWAAGRDDSVLAIRAYEESVRLNPDRTIVFLRLSDLYRSVGRPADADRALDRYVDASSDKATAHLTVAERLRIERRWDPAAAHIRRAIALRPKDPQPHRALARVHRAAERPEDEERAIETLVSVTPDTGTVLLEIGMDYRRRGDTVRAIRFLSRAADADGPLDKRRRALYLLGKVHLTLGDLEQMKTTDERYLALAPDESVHIRALESLARRYRKAHLTDQYLWALGEQVRLQPERAELYLRLGRLHLQRNDRDSATAAFRRFVSRSEDPVEALREVAGAYQ